MANISAKDVVKKTGGFLKNTAHIVTCAATAVCTFLAGFTFFTAGIAAGLSWVTTGLFWGALASVFGASKKIDAMGKE